MSTSSTAGADAHLAEPADGRRLSPADRVLARLGDTLRAATAATPGVTGHVPRPRPQPVPATDPAPTGAAPAPTLGDADRRTAASLMRVNHAGEVAAQGLYHGQALFARDPAVRRQLLEAAAEEQDHLDWCAERLRELGDGPSRLGPVWYAGSVAIGALAGLAGDAKSLGFVAETERQVSEHLGDHLRRLPPGDAGSRAVVTAMRDDEERHGESATAAGGLRPPAPLRGLMRLVAGVMKFGAARI